MEYRRLHYLNNNFFFLSILEDSSSKSRSPQVGSGEASLPGL